MKRYLLCFSFLAFLSVGVSAQTAKQNAPASKPVPSFDASRRAGGGKPGESFKYPANFEGSAEFLSLYKEDGALGIFDRESEILDLRDAFSKHYRNPDGTVTALMTAGPQHYEKDGLWHTILNDIHSNGSANGGTYPYANTYNSHHTFYGNGAGNLLMMEENGAAVFNNREPRLSFWGADGSELGSIRLTAFSNVRVSGNQLIYSEVSPGIDLVAEQNAAGFKYSYVIKNQQALAALPAGTASIGITETFEPGTGFTKVEDDGKITFRNGEKTLRVKKFLFYDSHINQNREKAVRADWNGGELSYAMSAEWFTDPNRTYPIYIDPTVAYTPTASSWWTGTVDDDSGCDVSTDNDSNDNIRIGFDDGTVDDDYYSGYAKFNINSLPTNACVQNAYSRFYQHNFRNTQSGGQCWGNDDQLQYYYGGIGPITFDPVPSSCDAINSAIVAAPVYGTFNVFSGYPLGTANGWKDYNGYNLNSVVTSARSVQNYMTLSFDQFGSHSDPGFEFCCFCTPDNDDWIDYRGWSDGNRPQLVVTYETPFVIGTAANISTNNVCQGTSVTLTLTGGTNGSVGNWAWYSGSCGGTAVGTSTASNASLTISAPAGTTTYYVRGENTCGNTSCQSVTLTVLQPSVAATSINASANPVCQGGSGTTLSAVGGSLGAGAGWQWYTNGCGTTAAGTGAAININPGSTTVYYLRAEGTCNTTVCRQITVTVNTPTVGGTPSVSVPSVCINNTVGVTLSGQNGSVLFWEMQYNGGGYTSIGNAGLSSITSPSLTSAGTYDFRARVQNAPCAALYSNVTSVTVVPASVGGTAAPALSPVCLNGNTTVSLSGHTGAVVNWERRINGGSWTNIGNAGLTSIPTGVLNTTGTWEYRAIVQNSPCGTTLSAVAAITVSAPSVGGTAASSGTLICSGDNPTISLTGNTGGVLYWERQVNGGGFNTIGNAGLTSFNTGALVPGVYDYRAVVQNAPCATATSISVSVTVSSPSVGGSAVATSTQLCQGSSTNITLSGHTGTVLNWERQVNGGGWTNFGSPGLTLINSGALNTPGTTEFRAVIQNGGCASVASVAASIQVDSTSVGGSVASDFASVCDGSPVTLTLSGNTGTVVQWERQYNGGGWTSLGNGGVNPFTSSALTPFGTYEFRALVQSGVCSSLYSLGTSVTVNENDDPSFNYSSSVFCQGGPNPSPTIALGGGTFTAVPAGLAINASNGIIDLASSAPGTYTVTYTTAGVCLASANQVVTITPLPDAGFSYSGLSYCLNAANPVPAVTTPGGTFSVQNPGLVFADASTGEINLALSQPGSYFVQYSLGGSCPSSTVQTVILTAVGNSTFAYSANAYCVGESNPSPSMAQFGGTFSASPLGLVFANASTGTINLTTSTPGTYTVTYTSAGACPSTSTQSITINPAGDAMFFYSASSFCKSAVNPVPLVSAPGGGFTSAPAGLIFVSPATGEIDLAASQPGNYTVTYTTGGPCPATYSQNVQVIQNQNATFLYAQNSYCQYNSDPTPSVAQIGGVFTASPAGLVFANQFTGQIDLSASAGGTYTITYTVPGACVGVYSQTLTVTAGAVASLSYPGSSFCTNGTDPAAVFAPVGGTFSASPIGLSIDAAGTIDLSASVAGGYTVSYTAPGACGTTATANVIVVTAPQAFIQPVNALCTGSPATILSASPAGGTWSGGAYINASGQFDPAVSGAGTFTVNYAVSGSGGCNATATYDVTVNASPVISIIPAGPFCSNDSIRVLTAAPLGGTWSGNPFVSVNGLFFPTESGAGVFPVVYTVSNAGCSGSAQISVQVINTPVPTINPVGTVCSNGAPVGLSASIGGGTWSGGAYISASGSFNPALASVGNNAVTYTVSNGGCTAVATGQVAVSGTPNVNLITPLPFCQNDDADFISANMPGGVFAGSGSYINGNGLFNPGLASVGNNTVIYTLTGSNGCVGSDTVNVVVNANPDASITYPGVICEGATAFTLTAATAGGSWSGGVYVNGNIFDPVVAGFGAHPVLYSVTVGGCTSMDNIIVTVAPKPVALYNFQPNGLGVVFTDISTYGTSWSWNFGDGSAEVADQNPAHLFPDNGTYQVRLIVFNDCGSDTLIRNVMVNKAMGINENDGGANLNAFPNPADQYIQLTAGQLKAGEWQMGVYDISGKQVMSETVFPTAGTLNKTVDVAMLKPGVYFIHLKNKEAVHTVKFVKM